MHIPRFFLTDEQLQSPPQARASAGKLDADDGAEGGFHFSPGDYVTVNEPAVVNQVRNVLRMRPGDRLAILDGHGGIFNCELKEIGNKSFQCRILQKEYAAQDESGAVTIGLPLIKGERFEWALQKLTELGVAGVVPLITDRAVVKAPGDAKGTANKLARWQAIVKEAAEQCERATIPRVVSPISIDKFIAGGISGAPSDITFICTERLNQPLLRDVLLQMRQDRLNKGTKYTTILVLVGPEGGLTEREISLAQDQGWKPVSLGPRILRSETAAIYSVAQIIWALEK
jgi:16S rRNA (uracil1498-N3)-methyltransferase